MSAGLASAGTAMPSQKKRRLGDRIAAALVLVLALAPLVSGDGFSLRFGAEILLIGTAVMSLNLLIGGGGLVSLGHAAVFGAAGYSAAVASAHLGAQLPLMLLIGIVAGTLIAGIMGLVTLRSSGLFFLVLTLVVGQMVWELAFRWRDVTGGADGLRGFPKLALGSLRLDTPLALYLVAGAIALLGWAVTRSFQRAPIGQALAGVRDQPIRMGALGYQVGRIRVTAFLVAGAVAGAAGAIYPFVNQYIGPNAVHWSMSAALIIMAVIGGVGSLYGGYLGAVVYLFVQTHVSSYTDRWQLVIGLIFVATVILMPNGIAHWLGQRGRGGRA
jgi:branched-chain amino acid transport system permease protein